jgi:hypothetical protein
LPFLKNKKTPPTCLFLKKERKKSKPAHLPECLESVDSKQVT